MSIEKPYVDKKTGNTYQFLPTIGGSPPVGWLAPWKAVGRSVRFTDHGRERTLVNCDSKGIFIREREEDHARLFAAGPEMFAALKVIVLTPAIHDWLYLNDPKALEQAQKALRKAEGGVS